MNEKLDSPALALSALSWILMDEIRAERLLALTGMTADGLRARLNERTVQAAILSFLENHEPDLVACAANLDIAPAMLVAAREELER